MVWGDCFGVGRIKRGEKRQSAGMEARELDD